MPEVISREAWAGRAPKGAFDPGLESRVVLHHTPERATFLSSSREDEIEALKIIESYHINSNGWTDIGYNFLFAQSGRTCEGRGWLRAGAHAGTRIVNFDSIGLGLMLNGSEDAPSPAMMQSIHDLLREGVRDGHIAQDFTITGHRDYRSTTCPGEIIYQMIKRGEFELTGPILRVPIVIPKMSTAPHPASLNMEKLQPSQVLATPITMLIEDENETVDGFLDRIADPKNMELAKAIVLAILKRLNARSLIIKVVEALL